MTAPADAPVPERPRRSLGQVLAKLLKRVLYLFLCLIGILILGGVLGMMWPFELGWYLAFGWIRFIAKNLAAVQVNPVLLTEGIACTVALGVGAHYFCRWLYREAGPSKERVWRWQWTASGVAVVMLLFVIGIGTIGVVHQLGWLLASKGPLLVSDFNRRTPMYEGILSSSQAREVVQEYYQIKGQLPQTNEEAGYRHDPASPSQYVATVEVRAKGLVVVTLKNIPDFPDGGQITLTPAEDVNAKTLTWKCSSTFPARLLPAKCRE
jgi:hypothetical protein